MSQYAAARGAIITPSTPPRCDACGRVMTSHKKRWQRLHARPVLICHECRALANPAVRRLRINHIHKLLVLENTHSQLPASRLCEPNSPGLGSAILNTSPAMQHRHSVSSTQAGQDSISETQS